MKDGYHSSSTLSCFVSFSLLVLMKLYNSLEVARNSVKDDKMTSAYMSEFVSFNVLDADYIEQQLEKKIKDEIQLEEVPITILPDRDETHIDTDSDNETFKEVNSKEVNSKEVKLEESI